MSAGDAGGRSFAAGGTAAGAVGAMTDLSTIHAGVHTRSNNGLNGALTAENRGLRFVPDGWRGRGTRVGEQPTHVSPVRTIILVSILGFVVAGVLWVERQPRLAGEPAAAAAQVEASAAKAPLRLGLVPERDIFAQRHRYRQLADYMAARLEQPVELVTLGSYEQILGDFADRQVDAAFLGSLVTVLAADRLGARVVVQPIAADGAPSVYHGVIFVREDSPLRSLSDLRGKTIVMVRATSAGSLFPLCELRHAGLLDGPGATKITWVGTHDDAVLDVIDGKADAGAAKDSRIEQVQRERSVALRRLATSVAVPENALMVRGDLADQLAPRLSSVLTQMSSDDEGKKVLTGFGAAGFAASSLSEYRPVYEMCGDVNDPCWALQGIAGPAPHWPVTPPATQAAAVP
jgi:phosphonate transport system substrate-binding protein